jgi:hypothetical protein
MNLQKFYRILMLGSGVLLQPGCSTSTDNGTSSGTGGVTTTSQGATAGSTAGAATTTTTAGGGTTGTACTAWATHY